MNKQNKTFDTYTNNTIETAYLIIMIALAHYKMWSSFENPVKTALGVLSNSPFVNDGEYELIRTPYQYFSELFGDCDCKTTFLLSAQIEEARRKANQGLNYPIGVIVVKFPNDDYYSHVYNLHHYNNVMLELDTTYKENMGIVNHITESKLVIMPRPYLINLMTYIFDVEPDYSNEELISRCIVDLFEEMQSNNAFEDYFEIYPFPDNLNGIKKDSLIPYDKNNKIFEVI